MEIEDVRVQCLELATRITRDGSAANCIATARQFEEYVLHTQQIGNGQPVAEVKPRRGRPKG